jgi:hypothetical protein
METFFIALAVARASDLNDNVAYWPKADIPTVAMNVRFRG